MTVTRGMPGELDEEFPDRSPAGIARALARWIAEGRLAPGDRLPTVRELAAALGVSPATVSGAWGALAGAGLTVSRGRAGTFVAAPPRGWLTDRVKGLSLHGGQGGLDLSGGTPDPALLPSLDRAFERVRLRADTGRYHDAPVLPELAGILELTWPVRAETITVVDGALDAISRTLDEVVRYGDRVAVESPGFPYFFDLIEALGAEAVPLHLDQEGVEPESLARALSAGPVAVILQPRAQNPTGSSMSPHRARLLARVIRESRRAERVVVIEDDHSGMIAMAPDVTLAHWLPQQVVHVRSFSKSHGPDLRIAAVGGPRRIVERVIARRMLGPGWTSRLLQAVLAEMLTDPRSRATVAGARLTYRDRSERLSAALRREGVHVAPADGINLWLPVADERSAEVSLASAGITVAAGSPFVIDGAVGPHVRVTAGSVEGDASAVAGALAAAARAVLS